MRVAFTEERGRYVAIASPLRRKGAWPSLHPEGYLGALAGVNRPHAACRFQSPFPGEIQAGAAPTKELLCRTGLVLSIAMCNLASDGRAPEHFRSNAREVVCQLGRLAGPEARKPVGHLGEQQGVPPGSGLVDSLLHFGETIRSNPGRIMPVAWRMAFADLMDRMCRLVDESVARGEEGVTASALTCRRGTVDQTQKAQVVAAVAPCHVSSSKGVKVHNALVPHEARRFQLQPSSMRRIDNEALARYLEECRRVGLSDVPPVSVAFDATVLGGRQVLFVIAFMLVAGKVEAFVAAPQVTGEKTRRILQRDTKNSKNLQKESQEKAENEKKEQ